MKRFSPKCIGEIALLNNVSFTPDGRWSLFTARTANVDTNSYDSELHLLNPKTGKTKRLASGVNAFSFLSNKEVLFPAIRQQKDKEAIRMGEELTVFYSLPLDGGEAEELFRLELQGAMAWKLGRGVYLVRATHNIARPDFTGLKGIKRREALKKWMEEADYEVADEFPYRRDGMGYMNKLRSRLYIYRVNGRVLTPVTPATCDVKDFHITSDKNNIYICGVDYDVDRPNKDTLWRYDVKLGKLEEFAALPGSGGHMAGAETKLYISVSNEDGDADIYSVSYADGKPVLEYSEEASLGFPVSCDVMGGGKAFAARGDELLFLRVDPAGSHICSLENGNFREIASPDIWPASLVISSKGQILSTAMPRFGLNEVYDVTAEPVCLTRINRGIVEKYGFSRPEILKYRNRDGMDMEGWVIKPVGYEEGKKYPGYLMIHGGPRGRYEGVMSMDMQLVASRDYFVFYCNPRGSDGVSRKFAHLEHDLGGRDYNDIMDFTDAVIAAYPDLDSERLGVGGGSYGGYMTNWIIGHTGRFKAAVSQKSISNWVSMYGTSDIPSACEREMGRPWLDFDLMWDRSPLKYADKAVTPTLFLQYMEDYRCPMDQAIQMYFALALHGIETKLIQVRGESHGMENRGQPKHRVRRYQEIAAWLDSHLAE